MTISLPRNAWAVTKLSDARANPYTYRFRRETGGWLLARAEAPDTIVAATGPGDRGESNPGSVWIDDHAFESVRTKELNARLERLGVRANLRPVPPPQPVAAGVGEEIVHTPRVLVRHGVGRVTGVSLPNGGGWLEFAEDQS